ncbi:MAG: DUF928 domain-containing protein [Symploca sp. SIO2C1]|nr:DUF928 domain-containing protein [Symploca sp. SIO2C1]
MIFMTSSFRLISIFLSLSVVLAPHLTAKAQGEQTVLATFEPPPGKDAPRGGTAGGGSRPIVGACFSNPSAKPASLTAVAPSRHIGLSQSDRPNLLVDLPQTTAQTAEVSLFDKQMNGIYQVSLPVSQAGLVNIPLPDNAPQLKPDQPYYWTVALVCNPNDRTEDQVVGGWIEHTQPSDTLKQQLEKVTAIEKVSLYAQKGFWYDALKTLVELQRTQPDNPAVATAWTQLTKSVGLNVSDLTVLKAIATQTVED